MRTLSPKGVDTKKCASENTRLKREMNCEISPRLERGISVSKDAKISRFRS